MGINDAMLKVSKIAVMEMNDEDACEVGSCDLVDIWTDCSLNCTASDSRIA